MYKCVSVPKRGGGERTLQVPNDRLKRLQKLIVKELLRHEPISPYATAYYPGSKLRDGASPHVGKKALLKIDLSDFFDSISFITVLSSAFSQKYYPRSVGTLLCELCCKDDCLPQGAPTSPYLSNIVMRRFDDKLGGWCAERGIAYTRYSDDITLSGDCDLRPAYRKARAMLAAMDLRINNKKTRLVRACHAQTVTGIVVNDHPQVSREYRRNLRQELYYFRRYGAEDVIRRLSLSRFTDENGQPLAEEYALYLRSKVAYVMQIDPHNKEFSKVKI